MNNKTKTYTLLIAVLCIWGVIGYKIISTLNTDTIKTTNQEITSDFRPQLNIKIDTFSIQIQEKDPFLGTLTNPKVKKPRSTTIKKKEILWPQISYHGLIKKQKSSRQIFVINISNKQYLLKKGQRVNEITLIRGTANQITISFKNERKTITIQ